MLIKDKLKEMILKEDLVPKEVLNEILNFKNNKDLFESLQSKAMLSEKDILSLFGKCLDIDFVDRLTDNSSVPAIFNENVNIHYARNHSVIAINETDDNIIVALSNPFNIALVDELSLRLGKRCIPVLAIRAEIVDLINKTYEQKVDVVEEMLEDLNIDDFAKITEDLDVSQDLLDMANKAPIIKLVNMIFFQALKMRASDIHIQPYEDKVQVRFRIDGILYDMMTPPKKIQEAIISRIKVMGKMDIAQHHIPQDGRSTIKVGDNEVDVRISSVPTKHGEQLVMRLLDKGARLFKLEELGLDKYYLNIFNKFITASHGVVLVTGPTGSGKTTSLYASLNKINSTEKHVITIEDPIEYHLPGISQIEVSQKKGLSFATGLRHIVRQDPDVIMVGEIRDVETAAIAIQSALTGHLVFSTLHTNDAAGAITRLLEFNIEPYLIASSVIGVVAQRLVRLICNNCKEPFSPDAESLSELGVSNENIENNKLYKGKGCDKCLGTGYLDRTGIYEVLPINEHIRDLIMQKQNASTIKQYALSSKIMRTLRMDGAQKVIQGRTTIDEVIRITQRDII